MSTFFLLFFIFRSTILAQFLVSVDAFLFRCPMFIPITLIKIFHCWWKMHLPFYWYNKYFSLASCFFDSLCFIIDEQLDEHLFREITLSGEFLSTEILQFYLKWRIVSKTDQWLVESLLNKKLSMRLFSPLKSFTRDLIYRLTISDFFVVL